MKQVCKDCHLEMETTEIGHYRIDMFLDPPRPYKIYMADVLECPKCLHSILVSNPHAIAEHFQDGFKGLLLAIYQGNNYTIVFEKLNHSVRYEYEAHDVLLGLDND